MYCDVLLSEVLYWVVVWRGMVWYGVEGRIVFHYTINLFNDA
jgi:hypothetical protein